jgi:hypothetical protein
LRRNGPSASLASQPSYEGGSPSPFCGQAQNVSLIIALVGGWASIRAKALSRTKISWAVPEHRFIGQRG